jgi:hypothetical protein
MKWTSGFPETHFGTIAVLSMKKAHVLRHDLRLPTPVALPTALHTGPFRLLHLPASGAATAAHRTACPPESPASLHLLLFSGRFDGVSNSPPRYHNPVCEGGIGTRRRVAALRIATTPARGCVIGHHTGRASGLAHRANASRASERLASEQTARRVGRCFSHSERLVCGRSRGPILTRCG